MLCSLTGTVTMCHEQAEDLQSSTFLYWNRELAYRKKQTDALSLHMARMHVRQIVDWIAAVHGSGKQHPGFHAQAVLRIHGLSALQILDDIRPSSKLRACRGDVAGWWFLAKMLMIWRLQVRLRDSASGAQYGMQSLSRVMEEWRFQMRFRKYLRIFVLRKTRARLQNAVAKWCRTAKSIHNLVQLKRELAALVVDEGQIGKKNVTVRVRLLSRTKVALLVVRNPNVNDSETCRCIRSMLNSSSNG